MDEEADELTEATPRPQTRTRIGWHPITLALVLIVAMSLLRAGAAVAMRRLWGTTDFEPSLQALAFLLVVFLIGSVGIVGGGLFGLGGPPGAAWAGGGRSCSRRLGAGSWRSSPSTRSSVWAPSSGVCFSASSRRRCREALPRFSASP